MVISLEVSYQLPRPAGHYSAASGVSMCLPRESFLPELGRGLGGGRRHGAAESDALRDNGA
jgi:hypothetical protein